MSWRFLTNNFWWKLGSLAMAVMLWLAILGEPELVTTHAVPILYRNLRGDLLIGSDALDLVRVELRGPSSRLTSSALSDLAVLLDLSAVSAPGERTFTLSDGDFHLPQGVNFLRAVPSQIRLRFSRRKVKDVPVEVRFASPLPKEYQMVGQEVIPGTVQIAGPEHRVDEIVTAQTDAIDLSSITETSDIRVNTYVADPQVWMESQPFVTVHLTVQKIQK
jgi:YbbR domain-containing protein